MTSPFFTSPIYVLPLELVDLIIGHAWEDLAVLASCSLVCRAWFPAARRHLFSKTHLDASNASSFIDLTNSTSSTITPFVHHIDVKDGGEDGPWVGEQLYNLQPNHFPYLTSISFTSSSDMISPQTLSIFQSFNRLTNLRLAECEFSNFTQVQTFLCSFPLLESLHLEADWPEPHEIAPTKMSLSSHLREVYLRGDMSHILEWFMMQPLIAPVSKLTLYGLDVNELPVVRRYLRNLGSALTHLTIMPFINVHDSLTDHIDLSFNPCLRYLKLLINCDSANFLITHTLLSQLTSPTFEEAELSFYSVHKGPDVDTQWANLDALFETPRFTSMLHVTIAAMFGAAIVRETLPLCDKRGILRTQRL